MSAGDIDPNRRGHVAEDKLLVRALRGETVERPPVWFMRQAGRYLPEYRQVRERAGSFLGLCYNPEAATEVTLQPVERFDLDAAIIFSDILVVPQALGQSVDFREGVGPVLEPIRSAAELDRLGRTEEMIERLEPVLETVRRTREALDDDVALIGFAGAPWTLATYMVEGGGSRDHARVKRWALSDPEGFRQLVDKLVRATSAFLIAQIEAGVDAVQIFDTWAGALPAPEMRRWSLDVIAAVTRRVKEEHPRVPVIAFPRGVGTGYANFVDAGVDALSLDPTVTLEWAERILHPQVALQGNLDPQFVVVGGAPMREAAQEILRVLGGGSFVFNLGHGLVPETPPAHVAELAALVQGWQPP